MTDTIRNLTLLATGGLGAAVFISAAQPGLAFLAAASAALLHLATSPAIIKEGTLLLIAGILGLTWETILMHSGLVAYSAVSGSAPAPLWTAGLWLLMATTINHALRWTKRSFTTAAVAGAIIGPVAFMVASQAGLVTLVTPSVALVAIALGWAALMPALNLAADTLIDSPWFETPVEPAPVSEPLNNRFTPAAAKSAVFSLQSIKPYF